MRNTVMYIMSKTIVCIIILIVGRHVGIIIQALRACQEVGGKVFFNKEL